MKKRKIEDQFADYVMEHKHSFYRLSYSYVKNSEDAMDVVQEAIHKALKSVHRLEDATKMHSWFYKIVVNAALDFLRKKKRVQVTDDDTLEFLSKGESDVYEDQDVRRAIEDLPEMYRVIIILRFFEDLKLEDIAHILEENENTIKTRLYKALRLLKVELSQEEI
ncbi:MULTISPECIES: RNA polymerase sigma factor [unclassified Bacillus (in: firmicutes)]|uniref:RNA polymerase sigma factor n=1 Tax=unclassified Bacillus (in: firmicutes) TaxID=185979 RepID=UPI000D025F09|nr:MULTISPECIES: RNA polymerase sigma factor [unclassified Bacillus (in: firmicutes)]PRS81560.1 RNA polymerase subunit sigma-70 [Bacillus sp. CJCL2]PRS85481.1 RNA polymerase subunit sigma-70 [Bacillus sp. YBWC18]